MLKSRTSPWRRDSTKLASDNPGAVQSELLGLPDIVTFDVGGTSTDVATIVNGEITETTEGKARIRVIVGPEIVAPFDQLKALQTGQFDMMVATSLCFNELRDLQFFHYLPFDEHIRTARQAAPLLQKISREKAAAYGRMNPCGDGGSAGAQRPAGRMGIGVASRRARLRCSVQWSFAEVRGSFNSFS